MDTQTKQRSRIAVLLIHEKKDGTIRQNQVKTVFLAISAVILLGLIVTFTVLITNNVRSQELINVDEHEAELVILNDKIDELIKDNDELSSKVSTLSETVATQEAMKEIKEEEIQDISLPKGFPLGGSGSVSMDVDEEQELTLIFNASEGRTIVTVGAGIVESIETDERYGTKLTIDHRNGFKSVYLNSGQPLVRAGEELGKRYILFLVGNNNKTLGFQIIDNERQVDPMDIMEISG